MQEQQQSISVPIAIVLAGALIAFGIYMSGSKNPPASEILTKNKIESPSSSDYVLGNRNAPIMIVEYSDIECPFCKQYHNTLHLILNEYEKDGKVAWAYRHFPVHKNSVKEAEAVECAGELGGNDAFWKYTDKIFAITPSNDQLDLAKLPRIANEIGLDEAKFNACLSSGKHTAKIDEHFKDMRDNSVQGTPYAAIFVKGELVHEVREGAVPFDYLKAVIDDILTSL